VIDSRGATDQPVRFGARTWRAVLGLLALGAAAACVLALVLARWLIAQGFDWADWALVIPIVAFTVLWLVIMAAITEWTIAGHELRRRRWLSWPGREPSTVMELGPHLEIVHETRSGWRIRPYGPTIYVPSRRTTPLTSAMERAGVRVIDWRGDWARRHRLLDRLRVPIGLGGGVGLLVTVAQGPLRALGFAAYCVFWGALMLGFAIDYLPWRMRKHSAKVG
jgi:hypothetical protein